MHELLIQSDQLLINHYSHSGVLLYSKVLSMVHGIVSTCGLSENDSMDNSFHHVGQGWSGGEGSDTMLRVRQHKFFQHRSAFRSS